MSISLITAPAEEPVCLDELKAHIRNVQPDEDGDITLKLLAARHHVEGLLNRALITSTWQLNLSRFPACGYIEIPLGNLQSIDFVQYTQVDGTVVTWDPSNYRLSRTYDPTKGTDDAGSGRLYRAWGVPRPPGIFDVGEPVCIQFKAGWADAAAVPPTIKSAILLLASHWYNHRDAVLVGRQEALNDPLSMAVDALLNRYIIYG